MVTAAKPVKRTAVAITFLNYELGMVGVAGPQCLCVKETRAKGFSKDLKLVLSVNDLHLVSTAVVEAARASLVIWARMTPHTPNNSETLRQIAIKAIVMG